MNEYERMLEEGWEDDDEEEGEKEDREHTPQENIDLATKALGRIEDAWIQNEFGMDVIDVLFDALNCFIEQEEQKNLAGSGHIQEPMTQCID